jgi:hypothetical protein
VTYNQKDTRRGFGHLGGAIEMPTLEIDGRCICSWSVVTPGVGLACISRMSYPNRACFVRHAAAAPVPSPAERLLTDIFTGGAR